MNLTWHTCTPCTPCKRAQNKTLLVLLRLVALAEHRNNGWH
jgi:hypothetical protein